MQPDRTFWNPEGFIFVSQLKNVHRGKKHVKSTGGLVPIGYVRRKQTNNKKQKEKLFSSRLFAVFT